MFQYDSPYCHWNFFFCHWNLILFSHGMKYYSSFDFSSQSFKNVKLFLSCEPMKTGSRLDLVCGQCFADPCLRRTEAPNDSSHPWKYDLIVDQILLPRIKGERTSTWLSVSLRKGPRGGCCAQGAIKIGCREARTPSFMPTPPLLPIKLHMPL